MIHVLVYYVIALATCWFAFRHGGRPEHAAGALQRVKRAEGGVHQLAVAGTLFEIEKGRLQLLQEVARLVQKDFEHVAHDGLRPRSAC